MRTRRFSTVALFGCLGAIQIWAQAPDTEPEDTQPQGGWRKADEPRSSDPLAPGKIELAAGTWIVIRVNEPLSSDHSMAGDVYTATLAQPVVADGFVLARRGQTAGGRVDEVQRAGKIRGTSRLGIELTEITLADGRQLPVRTQLIDMSGGTTKGRDATAIGTATGTGAAIGAAADGGFGAGMGAIAGAAASTIGVLMTRGRATEIHPEMALTFRLLEPATVDTGRASHAFQPVRQSDYEPRELQRRTSRRVYAGPPPFWGGGWWGSYYYPYSPFFYGPSFFYSSGPRFHGRGWGGRRR